MPIEGPTTVLIVDDDHDAGQNLGDILTDLGYQVSIATNGFEALELAQNRRFEFALLDFRMPGMDGITLSQKLKELSPVTVVILTTAYVNRDTVKTANQHGVWGVFPKPLDLKQIISCLLDLSQQPFVLLLEDDPDTCHALSDLLQEQGYRVNYTTEVDQALNWLDGNIYQVVLIDMKLTGGFGDEVYLKVRSLTSDARVILVTGYRHEMAERIERSLVAGADAVCYKPFHFPELLSTLHQLSTKTKR